MLTGWLYTTTRNAAANVVRTERRRKAREQAAQAMNDLLSDENAQVDWSQVAPVLDEAINQLGETGRVAILLRFIDRRAFAEIGATLKLNEDAARRRVERVLAKLRTRPEGMGIRSTSAALGLALANHSVLAAPPGLAAAVVGSAAMTAPAAAGALAFMTTTQFLGSTAAVLVLATVCGISIHQRQQDEAQLAAAEREVAARQVELAKFTRQRQSAEQAATGAAAKSNAAQVGGAGAPTLTSATAEEERARRLATWDPLVEGRSLMERHPALKQALVEQRTAMYRSRYALLFRELNLSESQIDTLVGMLLDRSTNSFPFGPGGRDFKLPAGRNLTADEVNQQIRGLLGKEGYRKYSEFSEAAPTRDVAASLARIVCFSDTPLSVEQSIRVAEIVAAHKIKGVADGYDWEAITRSAQPVLGAEQLAALALLRRQKEADAAILRAEAAVNSGKS